MLVTVPPLMSSVPLAETMPSPKPTRSSLALVQVPSVTVAVPVPRLPTVPTAFETLPPDTESVPREAMLISAAAWSIDPPLVTSSVPFAIVVPPE